MPVLAARRLTNLILVWLSLLILTGASRVVAGEQVYFSATQNVTDVLIQQHQRRNGPARHFRLVPQRARDLDRHRQSLQRRRSGSAARRSRLDLRNRPAYEERVLLAGQPGRARFVCASTRPGIPRSTTGRWRSSSARTSWSSDRRTTRRSSSRRYRPRTIPTRRCCSPTTRRSSTPSRPSSIGCGTTPRRARQPFGAPPYFKDWNDACANESTGTARTTTTRYPNPVPMIINTARLEPDHPTPPDLIWGQGPDFNNRLIQEINNETTRVDLVVYRLTVANITEALLASSTAGVPVRLIVERDQYLKIEVAGVLADAREHRQAVGGRRPDPTERSTAASRT